MKSYSLHIGINNVDTNHYQGWDGLLHGCVNDARFYHELAVKEGCSYSQMLLSTDPGNAPTTQNVFNFLDRCILELEDGDKLYITYSGHGGVLQDKNFDEDDFQDETWCMYDRQLLDDELALKFKDFKAGVQIYMISDSCHSGSISKSSGADAKKPENPEQNNQPELPEETVKYLRRFVPRNRLFGTYEANRQIYDPLMRLEIVRDEEIKASVLQIGACQDNEFAMEDGNNGLFTKTMMKLLRRNGDIGSYQELLLRTKRALSGIQRPNLLSYGFNHRALLEAKPFGSSYVVGTPRWEDAKYETIVLLIESDNPVVDLGSLPEFTGSRALPKPEKPGHVQYEHSVTLSQAASYPWDNAYERYQFLKAKQFPVTCVEPVIVLRNPAQVDQPANVPANPIANAPASSITGYQRLTGLLLSKMFLGKLRRTKGIGAVARTIDDNVLLTMMGLETVYVITREEELKSFRSMAFPELQAHLSDPVNFTSFTELVKESVYSSEYLTAHL